MPNQLRECNVYDPTLAGEMVRQLEGRLNKLQLEFNELTSQHETV
jgi:hypothetical protein